MTTSAMHSESIGSRAPKERRDSLFRRPGYWLSLVGMFPLCAILAMGAVWIVSPHDKYIAMAKMKTAHLDEEVIATAIQLFAKEHARLPSTLAELTPKYIRELYKDPWGAQYSLEINEGGCAVVSLAGRPERYSAIVARIFVIPASDLKPQPNSQDFNNERQSP
jgi:hypothetical protein